jgi:sulfite reductase alpha subunit-like flavoprotein
MAEYTTDVTEKKLLLFLCSRQGTVNIFRSNDVMTGANELKKLMALSPTLLDFFDTLPFCRPPLERLLDVLPPLAPRYYSICSSPLLQPHSVDVAFNVVKYSAEEKFERLGICTPYLGKIYNF